MLNRESESVCWGLFGGTDEDGAPVRGYGEGRRMPGRSCRARRQGTADRAQRPSVLTSNAASRSLPAAGVAREGIFAAKASRRRGGELRYISIFVEAKGN